MGLDDLLYPGTPARLAPGPFTATVVKSAADGNYVAPIDGDRTNPIGPCLGAGRLRVNTTVLVVPTDDAYWIAAHDGGDT